MKPGERFIRVPEVVALTGLKKSTIYRMIGEGSFPAQRRVGPNMVVWLATEIDEWMAAAVQREDTPRWVPPSPPAARVAEKRLPPLAPPTTAGEAAARIAGVVGLSAAEVENVPDIEIALQFPDWPLMMRRRTAAAYLDLTESAFIREVARGTLPKPIVLGAREAWSRHQLDGSIAKLLSASAK